LIIIGEKINGTLPDVRDAVLDRNADLISGLAHAQDEAGADYIDVNVATGISDERDAMLWAIGVVRGATSLPLCIDSSDPAVLEAGLEACSEERPLINSVTGTAASMGPVLALAARHSCGVVALPMDEAGIPASARERLAVCKKIHASALKAGVAAEDLFFDPLVLPLSADFTQGRVTIETLASIKSEFESSRTVMGASNASFGLPARSLINRALLSVACYFGLDAAIVDPTDSALQSTVLAAVVVAGSDKYCKDYMKAFRSGRLG